MNLRETRARHIVFYLTLLVFTSSLLPNNARIAFAATVPAGFTDAVVATGLTNPTAMALAPDGRIFVCEQGGTLRVIKNGALLATPFLTVTVDASGERGLLGVAFDPNFAVGVDFLLPDRNRAFQFADQPLA